MNMRDRGHDRASFTIRHRAQRGRRKQPSPGKRPLGKNGIHTLKPVILRRRRFTASLLSLFQHAGHEAPRTCVAFQPRSSTRLADHTASAMKEALTSRTRPSRTPTSLRMSAPPGADSPAAELLYQICYAEGHAARRREDD